MIYIDPSGHDFSLKEYNSDKEALGELGYNSDFATSIAMYSIYAGYKMRSAAKSYAESHDPQYYKGTLITWDNESDAYRHFGWNFMITRAWGANAAEAATANHEFIETKNYSIVSKSNDSVVVSIQVATLMDFHNNRMGRNLASSEYFSSKSADEMFKLALDANVIITSLDQVAGKYGFDSSLIYKGAEGKLYINAKINLVDSKKGLTVDDFKNYANWQFVKKE